MTPEDRARFAFASWFVEAALRLAGPAFVAGYLTGHMVDRVPELKTLHTHDVVGAYLSRATVEVEGGVR